jgi:hypothetical protein
MKGFLDGSIKHPGHGWLLEALLEALEKSQTVVSY